VQHRFTRALASLDEGCIEKCRTRPTRRERAIFGIPEPVESKGDIHDRSTMLILGWPGSIVEFLGLIDPLTQPKNSNSPAFDVVIPRFLVLDFRDQPESEAGVHNVWRGRNPIEEVTVWRLHAR
jgi:hypothetical protein